MFDVDRFHNSVLKLGRNRAGLPSRDESRRDVEARHAQIAGASRFRGRLA